MGSSRSSTQPPGPAEKRYRSHVPAAIALLATLGSPASEASLVRFFSDVESWGDFAVVETAVAFEEAFPPEAGPNGCRSPAGTVVMNVPASGTHSGIDLAFSRDDMACPIQDGSAAEAVSDLHLDFEVELAFDPPIQAFYGFQSSLATGARLWVRLFTDDGVDMLWQGVASTDPVAGTGWGWVSSEPIDRMILQTTEVGTTVIGSFVGLAEGEPSLESVGHTCGTTRGNAWTCDFALARSAILSPDELYGDNPREFDDFAQSVARTETTVLVGAPDDQLEESGAVYVFERNEGGPGYWGLVQKLRQPTLVASAGTWGDRLALVDDLLLVGGPDQGFGGHGVVHVFEDLGPGVGFRSWTLLSPPSWEDIAGYGTGLDREADRIAVGSPGTRGRGAVHVFEVPDDYADPWFELRQIDPPEGGDGQQFGWSVDLDGDRLAVGAPNGADGAVYLFQRDFGGIDEWGLVAEILPPSPIGPELFGRSVVLAGDLLFVGAPFRNDDRGAVYVLRLAGSAETTSWSLEQRLDGGQANGLLGMALDYDGRSLLVSMNQGARRYRPDGAGMWQEIEFPDHPSAVVYLPNASGFGKGFSRWNDRVAIQGRGVGLAYNVVLDETPVFSDSFESGTTDAWSVVLP